ncbi:MAG: hypothetical protein WCI76_00845 [bacterium]
MKEQLRQTELNLGDKKEAVMAKGEERYTKLAGTLSNAKTRVGGWFKSGFASMGRMFKGGTVAALSAPEAIETGVKYVGDKAGEGANFLDAKADQFDQWTGEVAESAVNFTTEKVQATKQFISTKAEQVDRFVVDKVELGQAIADLAKNQLLEEVQSAKEAVANRWKGLMEYGRKAIAAAELKRQQVKQAYEQRMNAIQIAVLREQKNIQREKLKSIEAQLRQLGEVEGMEANFTGAVA